MLPVETEEWPLFCSFFYIEDPTLCFNGVPDGPFQFVLAERVVQLLHHIIKGTASLPSKEKMLESYNGEVAACREGNKRYLYHYSPDQGFRTLNELYSLLPKDTLKNPQENPFTGKFWNVLG